MYSSLEIADCKSLNNTNITLFYLSIYRSIHPPIRPSAHPPIRPSAHPPIHPSIYPSIFLYVCLSAYILAVLGTASFFLSPQSANPQPNFNFLNPQLQVRNWTFKSLVRNRKSATTFRDS